MLSETDFIKHIFDGPVLPAAAAGESDMVLGLDGFDDDVAIPQLAGSFAKRLLEGAGFGNPTKLEKAEVILGTDAAAAYLPGHVYYWGLAPGRPHHTLLVEFEPSGRDLLAAPLYRDLAKQQMLEDALSRVVQSLLSGFEHGGAGRKADTPGANQNETLVVASIADDRGANAAERHRLVCFGTRSPVTGALEVFSLREEAKTWDRPLANEHLAQLYKRHFSKLGTNEWQDAFVSGEERVLAKALSDVCRQPTVDAGQIKGAVRELLDQIAVSFGIQRKQTEAGVKPRAIKGTDLPPNHSIAVDPKASRAKGFQNPFKGMRIYDTKQRLLGFVVYVLEGKAAAETFRRELRTHNHFHNVLVIYPDADAPLIEVWQGPEPLVGRLAQGGRTAGFEDEGRIVQLLSRFFVVSKSFIESPKKLAEELAWRAQHLKALAADELTREMNVGSGSLHDLFVVFNASLATLKPERFADAYAQAITYGMLSARWLSSDRKDLLFTRNNLADLLPATSPFLRALFQRLVNAHFDQNLEWLLDDITSLLARTDVGRVFAKTRDPAIHFYEDFLNEYDSKLRMTMGVFYTPVEVVTYIVSAAHQSVIDGFGLPLGLADTTKWGEYAKAKDIPMPDGVKATDYVVQILDPAVGTGTFPLRVLEVIFETMTKEWAHLDDAAAAANWRAYVHEHLLPRLNAFELMMAPYIVSHLRLGLALERGLAIDSGRDPAVWGYRFGKGDRLRVFLTNAMEMRSAPGQLPVLADEVAKEADAAETVKRNSGISVIIGNPPYDAVSGADEALGGWVKKGRVPGREPDETLLKDLQDVLRANNVIFSQDSHLNNLFVYFLRWSDWRVFEARGTAPGVVAMITPNSWFDGDSFMGLRKLARRHGDGIWCVDLGGEGRGANVEENIFGILTAVGISVVRRSLGSSELNAETRYRRLNGDVETKLAANLAMADTPFQGKWDILPAEDVAVFLPETGDSSWFALPALADLMPWQQPGCKFGRMWPIAAESGTLALRWKKFVASDPESERPGLFVTPPTGRSISTKVRDLPTLTSLRAAAVAQPVVRYGYRSFDRQWVLQDPRLTALERPSLWRSQSDAQLFLSAPMTKETSHGPCLTASIHVPDMDHFRGSFGGKDVIPLYREAAAKQPNVTAGLLPLLASCLGLAGITPEDLAAYVYALLSTPRYQQRFAEALKTPGPRVPITSDPGLWSEAVATGERLLWLHTYAERFVNAERGRGIKVPAVPGLAWTIPVTKMPDPLAQVKYDAVAQTLTIGNGRVSGVRPEVWEFSVSGMKVVRKWLGYRTLKGAGKAASSKNPLDKIRLTSWPQEWTDELLDLLRVLTLTVEQQAAQADLLDRICDGPLIPASDLPVPTAAERKVPIEDDDDDDGQPKLPFNAGGNNG